MNDPLDKFINALHAIQLYRNEYASSEKFHTHMDDVITILVGQNTGRTIIKEIAEKIIEKS